MWAPSSVGVSQRLSQCFNGLWRSPLRYFVFLRAPPSLIALHTAPRYRPNLPERCSETPSREFWLGHFWVEHLGFCTTPALALISALASSRGHGRRLEEWERGKRRDKEGEREQSRADAIKRLGHRSQCQASVWLIHHHSAQELFLLSVWMCVCVCLCPCVCVWERAFCLWIGYLPSAPQLGGTSASQCVLSSGEPG